MSFGTVFCFDLEIFFCENRLCYLHYDVMSKLGGPRSKNYASPCSLWMQTTTSTWKLLGHSVELLTRLLRQITGHMEQPRVQQQHRQPQTSHFMFSGNVFRNTLLIRFMDAVNSSGATCYQLNTSCQDIQVWNMLTKYHTLLTTTHV